MAADPRPANDTTPPRPSLVDRILAPRPRPVAADPLPEPETVASPPRPRLDRMALAAALLIVAAPLATLAGATWLAADARAEAARWDRQAVPVAAARSVRDRARSLLAAAWTRPTLGATTESVARALPADAALLRTERTADGHLTIEVAAPDPDRLAAALRRDPALGGLRAVAQARGDATMRVTLEQRR
jgi:hypothetical protein